VDVYRVLLAGTLISSALFAIGQVRALLHPETYLLKLEWVRSHYHWAATGQGLKEFDAFTLMMVATALLILTPVLRVVISIWAFWVDRDYKYVVVSNTVLDCRWCWHTLELNKRPQLSISGSQELFVFDIRLS
jgi:uncharacterized membrane protein